MTRYFVFVFLTNFIAAFVYQRVKKIDLTKTIIVYVCLISLVMSVIYPFLLNWLNIFQVSFLYVFAALFVGIILANLDNKTFAALEKKLDNLKLPVQPLDLIKAVQKRVTDFKKVPQKVYPSIVAADERPEPESEEGLDVPVAVELETAASLLNESPELQPPMDQTGESLSDINFYIDKGFAAKLDRNFDLAVAYFRQALGLSPANDLMTLLVFDISSMCRELGKYQEAKEILNSFLETRGGELSDSLRRDISTSIEYLNILQDILQENNTPNLPIASLPSTIREAADARLAEQAS